MTTTLTSAEDVMQRLKKEGGPAFPSLVLDDASGVHYLGITVRDFFAAAALQGLLSRADYTDGLSFELWIDEDVCRAYGIADAMIKERKK